MVDLPTRPAQEDTIMMRFTFRHGPAPRRRLSLALLAALLAAACGDVNFHATAPSPVVPQTGAGIRTLAITGSLTAEQGGCIEARVLYDGRELPGSTVVCPDDAGCTRLNLSAETTTASGLHTLSLQVLRQPLAATTYVAEVTIRITREGLDFVLPISPNQVRTTLRAGETVNFELSFAD